MNKINQELKRLRLPAIGKIIGKKCRIFDSPDNGTIEIVSTVTSITYYEVPEDEDNKNDLNLIAGLAIYLHNGFILSGIHEYGHCELSTPNGDTILLHFEMPLRYPYKQN